MNKCIFIFLVLFWSGSVFSDESYSIQNSTRDSRVKFLDVQQYNTVNGRWSSLFGVEDFNPPKEEGYRVGEEYQFSNPVRTPHCKSVKIKIQIGSNPEVEKFLDPKAAEIKGTASQPDFSDFVDEDPC